MENKFREDKKLLENDLQKFYDEINSLDLDIHINIYEAIVEKIDYLESQIEPFNQRIENNFKDEEKLFSYKLNTFEEYDRLLEKLSKFSLFWRKAFVYYEIKKQTLLYFSEDKMNEVEINMNLLKM